MRNLPLTDRTRGARILETTNGLHEDAGAEAEFDQTLLLLFGLSSPYLKEIQTQKRQISPWRIIPVSKWLGSPSFISYEWPFGRGPTTWSLGDLPLPWLLTTYRSSGMILQGPLLFSLNSCQELGSLWCWPTSLICDVCLANRQVFDISVGVMVWRAFPPLGRRWRWKLRPAASRRWSCRKPSKDVFERRTWPMVWSRMEQSLQERGSKWIHFWIRMDQDGSKWILFWIPMEWLKWMEKGSWVHVSPDWQQRQVTSVQHATVHWGSAKMWEVLMETNGGYCNHLGWC